MRTNRFGWIASKRTPWASLTTGRGGHDPACGYDAAGAEPAQLRHAHRVDQWRWKNQLAGIKQIDSEGRALHNAVFSFEASRVDIDKVSLATSGITMAAMTVEGKASHAGVVPERGVNALYELPHQLLNLSDLSDPKVVLVMYWTVARQGWCAS